LPLSPDVIFKFGDRSQNGERELACAGRGVHAALLEALKADPGSCELRGYSVKVADRPCKPIQPSHDEGIPCTKLVESAGKFGTVERRPAAALLAVDPRAAGDRERVDLHVQ